MIIMHDTNRNRLGFFALALASALLSGGIATTVSAQSPAETPGETKPAKVKDTSRDPFKKYEPPRPIYRKSGVVIPPTIQERIAQYKAQKAAAMSARMAAPKPTTALLLEEIQVVGISRTPRGYAAIVEATPIKLSYVVYPGERFFNGQLVAIEDSRLVFRRETVFSDGRRERTVELKALRQPTEVNSMAASKTASGVTVSSDEQKKSDDKAALEKP